MRLIISQMARSASRAEVGKRFTEGARQLWALLARDYDGSQQKLAAAIGVTPAVLSRWLYGDRVPRIGGLTQIEKALGIKFKSWSIEARPDFVLPGAKRKAKAAA